MMTQLSLMSNTGEPQHGRPNLLIPVLFCFPETTRVIFNIFMCCKVLLNQSCICCFCMAFICDKQTGATEVPLFAAGLALISCGWYACPLLSKIKHQEVSCCLRIFSNSRAGCDSEVKHIHQI